MSSPACHWVRSVLTAYLDGELKPSTAEAVRHHLERCPECARHATELEQAWKMLDSVATAAPPLHIRPGFTERMMARIVEEKELEAFEARLRRGRRAQQFITQLTGLAAGLALGVVLYTWTGLPVQPNSPVEQEVSRSVAFLEDADLLDEMAVVETMEQITGAQVPENGA
ncbi:MAG: zf-HC2 domain-containing protein [Planctomycetota bacterium]|nr:zf-HC2 domain-containing protein [Planctomycetota bacterium]